MIKHIVMWKLKDFAEGADRSNNALRLKQELEILKNDIPQIITIEAGVNCIDSDAAYDIVLTVALKDEESLRQYQNHPAHQAVAAFAGKIREHRVVVDYMTDDAVEF